MLKQIALCTCFVLSAVPGHSQGSLYFTTKIEGLVDLKVTDCETGLGLSGNGWSAQLWGGAAGVSESQLVPLFPSTTFASGGSAGYVIPVSEVVVPNVVPSQTATVQLRVWNNRGGTVDSYEEAAQVAVDSIGKSRLFQIENLGDPQSNESSPVWPLGFGTTGGFCVPEPTVTLFVVSGLVLLGFWRLGSNAHSRCSLK